MDNAALVDRGDLDELNRQVDRLAESGDWDALLDLRDRCRAAFERGKQLWPAASHAEYRLALEAPGAVAAQMLVPSAGRFALGPLPEVIAMRHTWEEVAEHVSDPAVAGLFAHERVMRGEDLRGDPRAATTVIDLPLSLCDWEPEYALAEYRPDGARFLPPRPATLGPAGLPAQSGAAADEAGSDEVARAFHDLVGGWTSESNGKCSVARVEGTAIDAIRALEITEADTADITTADAVAQMAWAAASGGAHGRRRGGAAGRFGAWWALSAITDLLDPWPPGPDALGAEAESLLWLAWDEPVRTRGWVLRLAVEDEARGTAWAINAVDRH